MRHAVSPDVGCVNLMSAAAFRYGRQQDCTISSGVAARWRVPGPVRFGRPALHGPQPV